MKTIVVMPAFQAERTVQITIAELPPIYEKIIVCDDASMDNTYQASLSSGAMTLRHDTNRGYGANQKTLYREALSMNPDIVVMVHPDHQYNTQCVPTMIELFGQQPDVALILGSRMKTALGNQMPWWKYLGNRFLTMWQNLIFGQSLSEYHSGLRAYRAEVLRQIPYNKFSDDFVFDSEMIAWMVANKKMISEVETECYYNDEVSSINFRRSVRYGLTTLGVLGRYWRGYYTRLKK